jgi:gamma-glutamyltranspeptidase/glutathione hydrolase
MIDHGLDIQQALDAPRFLSGRFAIYEARDTLYMEGRFPAATVAEMKKRGHRVHQWGDRDEYAGHAHGITIDARTGLKSGGADPRSDGAAIGY